MCQNSPTAMQEVKKFSGGKTPGPPAAASNAAGKGAYNAGEGRGKGGGEGGGKGGGGRPLWSGRSPAGPP